MTLNSLSVLTRRILRQSSISVSVLILRFCSYLFPSDRTHKRYYYTNKVTGDSQWEYPSEEFGGDMDVDAPSEEAPAPISVAAVTSNRGSVPVWSYPGEIWVPHTYSA